METLKDLKPKKGPIRYKEIPLGIREVVFGYTEEDLKTIIRPMAELGKEPIGSMGSDTPIAVLSERPQLIYNYFKQLFAQVTNPPLDGIREELITDISLTLGSDGCSCKKRIVTSRRPSNSNGSNLRVVIRNVSLF